MKILGLLINIQGKYKPRLPILFKHAQVSPNLPKTTGSLSSFSIIESRMRSDIEAF